MVNAQRSAEHSYLLKLGRARAHLGELEQREREFFRSAPPRLEGYYSDDRSTYSFRFRESQPPPAALSLVVGDFLTNLMASLDHLVYELSSVKSDKTGFPICESLENFNAEVGGQKLTGLKQAAVQTIRGWQPFSNSPQNPQIDLLSMLKTLANWDKHRTLHLTVAHPKAVQYSPWIVGDLMALAVIKPPASGAFKDGDIVAEFRIPAEFRDRKAPIIPKLEAALLFDEAVPSPTSDRWWAVMLLQRILSHVEENVLPSLAKYL